MAFLDRSELREKLRGFLADPEQTVLVVDGPPDSGRSYTYELIRHLGQHCGFRPVRVTLSRTSTAARLMERLGAFVAGPGAGVGLGADESSLNPTRLNDPLPSYEDAAHRIVGRATAAEESFWIVLDDCDRLDPNSDVWDCIGVLARAVYEHTPVRQETAPRLVLLGYSTTMRQLPYEIRKNECRDTTRLLDEDDLRAFFREFFGEFVTVTRDPEDEDVVRDLTETAVSEVLCAADRPGAEDSYMRRVCTAVEDVVRLHRVFPPLPPAPGDATAAARRPAHEPRGTRAHPARPAQVLPRSGLPPPGVRPGAATAPRRGTVHRPGGPGARRRLHGPALPGATAWTLKPEIRETALASLVGPDAALRALLTNIGLRPEGPGPEHTALALLTGASTGAGAVDGIGLRTGGADADALCDTLQAVLWLGRVPGITGLPPVDDVQHRLEEARLLQPMHRLLHGTFHGRAAELDSLHAYLALPEEPAEPPSSSTAWAASARACCSPGSSSTRWPPPPPDSPSPTSTSSGPRSPSTNPPP